MISEHQSLKTKYNKLLNDFNKIEQEKKENSDNNNNLNNICKHKFLLWINDNVQLPKYLQNFIENELNHITLIQYLDEETLKNDIKIKNKIHLKKIMIKINDFKDEQKGFDKYLENKVLLKKYKTEFEKFGILTLKHFENDIETKNDLKKILKLSNDNENKINLIWNEIQNNNLNDVQNINYFDEGNNGNNQSQFV